MTSLNGQTIGFIGLGLMGRPMARNLKVAGAEMIVHNRSQGVIKTGFFVVRSVGSHDMRLIVLNAFLD